MAERRPLPAALPEQAQDGPFERETAVRLLERDGPRASFAGEVAGGWRAGRGPHGGYLAAMILRALTHALEDPARWPRSLTIHFLAAPLDGPVLLDTVIERAGRSLSTLSARMTQDGSTMAIALAAFSVPWTGPQASELAMPAVEPPSSERRPGALIPAEKGGPPFGRQIVFQPRLGGVPFAGAAEPMEAGGWIGLVEPRPLDAPVLAFFTDALIPAPFMRMAAPSPAPTIDLTIHFRAALPRPAKADQQRAGTAGQSSPEPGEDAEHELVLARTRASTIHEGFFEEDAVIWAQDGTLLAQSRQLALLIS